MYVVAALLTTLSWLSGVHGYCHWRPAPGSSFQWQLQGTLDLTVDASIFDIDLFDAQDSDITTLKSNGKKVICYFSAGSHENWRSDVSSVPNSALGSPLHGWPGERWWDVRATSVRDVISGRLDLAVSRGCDAVEPDNVDAYDNNNGLGITECDQLDFNRWIAYEAHHRGLSIGLKNAVGLLAELESSYDWALNEECLDYTECLAYQRFLDNHKAVFHVEYVDEEGQGGTKKTQVCASSQRPSGFTTLIKTWDLTAWRLTC